MNFIKWKRTSLVLLEKRVPANKLKKVPFTEKKRKIVRKPIISFTLEIPII